MKIHTPLTKEQRHFRRNDIFQQIIGNPYSKKRKKKKERKKRKNQSGRPTMYDLKTQYKFQ